LLAPGEVTDAAPVRGDELLNDHADASRTSLCLDVDVYGSPEAYMGANTVFLSAR
jgi:hypothetical protein